MSLKKQNFSLEEMTIDSSYPILFNNNNNNNNKCITSKGGIMRKESLWRSKNMNLLVKFESMKRKEINNR